MKILHLFNEIKYSGAELMYAKAAPIFQEKGIEMYAFSTGKELGEFAETLKKNNIKVFHFFYKPGKFISIQRLKSYFRFYKFLKHNKIDILHIHRSDIYFLSFIARLLNIPTIKTMHSVFRNPFYTYPYQVFQRWVGRRFYKIVFQTIGDSVYLNELNYYKNPSVKINNWYDGNKFYPATIGEKKSIRKKLGIEQDKLVIVSVGGCSYIKNHHDIIRAISIIPEKDKILYIHLGTGSTEKEEKQMAISLGVLNNIYFLGNKNNVRDYLIASDIYIQTSHHEGLSIAALEAMACGLPSILYNSPGLRDLISNNNNGFLIEPKPEMLVNKIQEYVKTPILMQRKGKAAINFANTHFSMNKNVLKIMNLYSKMITQKSL